LAVKAIHNCVKLVLLWYGLFTKSLKGMGFVLNPYDPCIANCTIEGTQCTAAWYVDDNKILHINPDVLVTMIIKKIERGCAAQFPTGFCTAIRTGTFLEEFKEAPGAMSIFCFGPQFTSQITNNMASDDPEAIVQMQLKLTETTSGLSDKDIKTMTKLVYTVPSDFKDLADICQVMAGVHKLIIGAASMLAEMLSDWFL
jgi:hypothetical protein